MAVPAFVQGQGAASNKVAGTTITIGANLNPAVGNLLVAYILFDNAGVASKPIVSSISKQAGETNNWVFLGAARSTSTTAGSFVSGEMWCIQTTVAWAHSSTVTLDTSVTQKAIAFSEFSGVTATARSTAGTAYSTTTAAASATTTGTTPVINDLALGFVIQSNSVTNAANDTDTVGGSWAAMSANALGSTGGNATTNNWGNGTYKVLTAASHQTLNSSAALTAGNGAIVAVLQAILDPAITQASYRLYADGTESGSVALAAQDTSYNASVDAGDVNLLVRARLQSTNAGVIGATDDWQLQYERNASGTWVNAGDALADSSAAADTSLPFSATIFTHGQSFFGNGRPVTRAATPLRRVGAPTGNITAQIYAHTGTFGSSSVPTGSPLATSTNSVAASTLTTTSTPTYFTFDGTLTLTNSTPYVVAFTHTASDGSNFVAVGANLASVHAGNCSAISSTGTAAPDSMDVPFEVYTASSVVPGFNSANLTDGAATTNRLGAGTGSFVAGKVSEDGLVDDLGWTANNYTELLYAITLKQAGLANADTLRFRILRNGVTTGLTYTQTPTVTITKTVTTAGMPKVYLAGAFTSKPMKVWSGSAWVTKPVKVWTGSTWRTLT